MKKIYLSVHLKQSLWLIVHVTFPRCYFRHIGWNTHVQTSSNLDRTVSILGDRNSTTAGDSRYLQFIS